MRILMLVVYLVAFAHSSFAQNGTIVNDQTVDGGVALAYRAAPSGRFDMLIGTLVAKARGLGPICFTFGEFNSDSADPTKTTCVGTRSQTFTPGQWMTLTNSGCSPSRYFNGRGIGCEKVHMFAVKFNPLVYTRLTPVSGIQVTFVNNGSDSVLPQPPTISSVRYTVTNQTASTSTTTKGVLRILGQNLNPAQRYAALVDGVPFSDSISAFVVSGRPVITESMSRSGYVELTGFTLPEGAYQIQLAEFVNAPQGSAGLNVFAAALRPFAHAMGQLQVIRGLHSITCSSTPDAGPEDPQCFAVRGLTEPQVAISNCSNNSTNTSCVGRVEDNLIASTNIITRRTDARPGTLNCAILQSVPHCAATIDKRRSAHTNPKNAFDVNNDGNISPLDVLAIVNFINIKQEKDEEPNLSGETPGNPNYLDVNGDNYADALDALQLINYMNSK